MQNADRTIIVSFDPWNEAICHSLRTKLIGFNHSQWDLRRINRAILEMRNDSTQKLFISLDYIFAMKDDGERSELDRYIECNVATLDREITTQWGEIFKTYFVLGTGCGDSFSECCKTARSMATANPRKDTIFNFNDIDVIVAHDSDLELINRDYMSSWSRGVNRVDPYPVAEYDAATLETMRIYNEKRQVEHEKYMEEVRKEEELQKTTFQAMLRDGEEMRFISDEGKAYYDEALKINTDAYGARCVSYANEWARLMQSQIAPTDNIQDKVAEIAEATSRVADYDGITGFMYGAAVNILAKSWIYGEELRKWHNKEYKYEGTGVVNPAVMSIAVPAN